MAGFSSAPVLIPSTSSSARSPRLMRATSALEYGSPVRPFLTIPKRRFSRPATSLSPSSGSTHTAFRISFGSSNHISGGNPMAFAMARSLSKPGFSILPLPIMLTYERVTTPPVASWSCWPFHRVPLGRRYLSRSNSNFWEIRNRVTPLVVQDNIPCDALFNQYYLWREARVSFRVQSVPRVRLIGSREAAEMAIEMTGGKIVDERGTVVTFRQKCEECGYVFDFNKTTIVLGFSPRKVRPSTCRQCGNHQEVDVGYLYKGP